jgi:spermidine/putrescine transport system permease protein
VSLTADGNGPLDRLRSEAGKLLVTAGPSGVWLGLLLLMPLTFMITVSFMSVDENYNIVWQPTAENYAQLFAGEGAFWQTSFFESLTLS